MMKQKWKKNIDNRKSILIGKIIFQCIADMETTILLIFSFLIGGFFGYLIGLSEVKKRGKI